MVINNKYSLQIPLRLITISFFSIQAVLRRKHLLRYSLPSLPHTGLYRRRQDLGHAHCVEPSARTWHRPRKGQETLEHGEIAAVR